MYYMPWKNLQTLVFDPRSAPRAASTPMSAMPRVYGMESNVKYQASNAYSAWSSRASYNDARVLTNNFATPVSRRARPESGCPTILTSTGAQCPLRSPDPGLTAEGLCAVRHRAQGRHVERSAEDGSNGLPRVLQPGYSIMNLRFGLNQSESTGLAEFYITNFTNKNAVIYTNEGNFDLRYTRNEPRVFGGRLSYRWGKAEAE
jgi:hypothetical protein